MKDENNRGWRMAETWNDTHGAMRYVPVPDGYKSDYEYKTATAGIRPVPKPFILSVEPGEDWGIVSFTSDHLLDELELKKQLLILQKAGISCPGMFRLISQTFKLDIR